MLRRLFDDVHIFAAFQVRRISITKKSNTAILSNLKRW
jgi:hypothetical protein